MYLPIYNPLMYALMLQMFMYIYYGIILYLYKATTLSVWFAFRVFKIDVFHAF